MSSQARHLGALLFMHAANTWEAFPSQEQLAAEMAYPREKTDKESGDQQSAITKPTLRSIQRWLRELESCGWLSWRQTMRNNHYTLCYPAEQLVAVKHMFATTLRASAATGESQRTSGAAILQSPSATIVGSHSDATPASPTATVESRPTYHDQTHDQEIDRSIDDTVAERSPMNDEHTATELYLLEVGFNPTTAREFCYVNLEVARVDINRRLGSYAESERTRHIGGIVTAWRRHSPNTPPANDELPFNADNIARWRAQGLWHGYVGDEGLDEDAA